MPRTVRRGPKPAVYSEEILYCMILNEVEIIEEGGFIKTKGNKVWLELSKALDERSKPLNLYISITQNRWRILEEFLERTGYVLDEEEENIPEEFDKEEKIDFQIEISGERWELIRPSNLYPNTLRSYYKAIINKVLWDHAELPCCFIFENATVRVKEDPSIVINGYCVKCKAKILLESKEVYPESAVFYVTTENPYDFQHYEKKTLSEDCLKKLMKLFGRVKKKRIREPVNSKSEDDQEPDAKLIRREITFEELQNTSSVALTQSLQLLLKNEEYIKEIGINKFFVTYWLESQIQLYSDIQKHLKSSVYIASSEPLLFKIDDEKHEFVWHIILTSMNDILVPAMQIFTEESNKNILRSTLLEWRKSEVTIPCEIIVDSNNIMLDSVCFAFNSVDLVRYIDKCFQMLTSEQLIEIDIYCFIRVDIVNIIDRVSQWDFLKKSKSEVKLFYKKCIGLLVNCYNLSSFATILEKIFTVAYSKFSTNKFKEAQDYLNDIMKDCDFREEFWTSDQYVVRNDEDIKHENTKTRPIYSFINELRQGVELSLKRIIPSFDLSVKKSEYYSIQLIAKLCELCLEFPVWSNVMQNYILNMEGSSTTMKPRNYFDELNFLMIKRKRRIDDYVIAHAQKIETDIEAARTVFESIHLADTPDSMFESVESNVVVSVGHDHNY